MKSTVSCLQSFLVTLVILFLVGSCQKAGDSLMEEDGSLKSLAKKWFTEQSTRSTQSSSLDLDEFTIDWSKGSIGYNVQEDSVFTIQLNHKGPDNNYYYELNVVRNDIGNIFGLIKEYLGDPFGTEQIFLRFYSGTGDFLRMALYDPSKGTMRYANRQVGQHKACRECAGNMNDGYIIEDVEVTGYLPDWNPDEADRYNYPEVPGSPQGSGGGGPGGSPSQTKGFKYDKLSEEDKNKLKDAIENAKNQNCAYKALLEAMGKNGDLSFVVDGNRNVGGGGATYFANTKEIVYAGSFALGHAELLTHEGFHAYQHQVVYGSGFGNYSMGKPGNINMEFEQIVFQDIVTRASGITTGVGEMFTQKTKAGFDDASEAYMDWLNALTNKGTSHPNLQARPNFEAEFSRHLDSFQKYGHEGYTKVRDAQGNIIGDAVILDSLKPEALKKLFDGLLNCNK